MVVYADGMDAFSRYGTLYVGTYDCLLAVEIFSGDAFKFEFCSLLYEIQVLVL